MEAERNRMDRIKSQMEPGDCLGIRFTRDERDSLWHLLRSGARRNRRLCNDWLKRGALVRGNRAFVFGMCDKLIPDRSEYMRWGACSILGEYAKTHAKQLWPLILKWGSVPSRDIRNGIACCILEHVFEFHFEEYFPKAVRHASKHPRFAYTIQECYKFGQALEPANSALFDRFVASYKKRHKPKRFRRPG